MAKTVFRVSQQVSYKAAYTASRVRYRLEILDRETKEITVIILSFRTDRSGQTVQTQIRLLLGEQSDQGLHCLLFHLHLVDGIRYGLASLVLF